MRLRRGVMPAPFKTSAGSQVSSEPVSTSVSKGLVANSSRLGLRATTLTLNILMVGSLPYLSLLARRRGAKNSNFVDGLWCATVLVASTRRPADWLRTRTVRFHLGIIEN